MFKYIGIRGHRGAGKNTFSYLLGVTLNYYLLNKKFDDGYNKEYKIAVDKILELNEDFLETSELSNIYFESFADTAKITLAELIGIPSYYMYNDWCKDSVFVDLKNFHFLQVKEKIDIPPLLKTSYTARQLYDNILSDKNFFLTEKPIYMQLRELITYYSKYVMQVFFGSNVWVKSLEKNRWEQEKFYSTNKIIYKIYTDCKFSSEVSYIKNNNGIIIQINRDENIKDDTEFSNELHNDARIDYYVNWNLDLYDYQFIEELKSLALKILS